MGIDIRTLVLIIGLVHLMQVFIFYHQYKTNKFFAGPGWWLLWSAAEFIGFGFILLRDVPSLLSFSILLQDPIIILGTLFLYFGIVTFFDKKVKLKFISLFFLSFVFVHVFFFLVFDNIRVRSIVFDFYIAFIAFMAAVVIYRNKTASVNSIANFIIVIFGIHGSIFLFRSVVLITNSSFANTDSSLPINLVQFMDALLVGILWTFGFIMLLNQRLNADISEAKSHFELIFNTSPDAAIITRLSDGRFIDCNDGFTKISGYTRQEIAGKSSLDIQLWENVADRDVLVKAINEKNNLENHEFVFRLKNGQTIIGLMSATSIMLKSAPHIISVIRDISDLKKSEQEIKIKNEELQKVNLEKDRFLSIIAHDLKSPFNGFLGLTQIITDNFSTLTRENIQAMALSMRESATNLYRLLENLLQWSQIQKGSIAFKPEVIHLQQVIREVLQLEEEHAKNKRIEISSAVPETMTVLVDFNFIHTIIRNLVSNALKFTPKGGQINITSEIAGRQMVTVCVKDTGIGIPPHMVENLFRLDADTRRHGTDDEPSTGLGLILIKEFIEKNSGTIWVESEVGKGSNFYFTLPLVNHEDIQIMR